MSVIHKMRRNERSGCPSSFVAIDTETVSVRHGGRNGQYVNVFKLGVGITWRVEKGAPTRTRVEHFDQRSKMLHWLYRQGDDRKRTWVFAHNIGFDLTALQFWRFIEQRKFQPAWKRRQPSAQPGAAGQEGKVTGTIVIEDPPTILDLQTDTGRKMAFVDLMNYFPVALSVIGDCLNVPKLPFPGDDATDEYWHQYCERDARIVMAAVCELRRIVKDDDLGNFRYTTSGQSLAMFRHRCMTADIVVGHPPQLKEMERRAYYGLQPQCFYIGHAPPPSAASAAPPAPGSTQKSMFDVDKVYRVDVNSCYPFVMRDNVFPVEYLHTEVDITPAQLSERMACLEGCADVVVESLRKTYPCRQDGRTIWATGRFQTTLCGQELREALARKEVVSVQTAQFYRGAKPFRKWVDEVWKMRERYQRKGWHLQAMYAKMLSVSLHGKLGQRNQSWDCVPGVCPPTLWGSWTEQDIPTQSITSWRSIGGVAQIKSTLTETSDNMPLIAAYVTGYARSYLTGVIATLPSRSVYYWDADSVHISSAAFAALTSAGLVHPQRYGCLKTEVEAETAEYRGPKNYRIGDEWTIAGVRERTAIDPQGMCHDTHFHGLAATLQDGPPAGPLTEEVTFTLPVPQVDGLIGKDGWVIPPRIVWG